MICKIARYTYIFRSPLLLATARLPINQCRLICQWHLLLLLSFSIFSYPWKWIPESVTHARCSMHRQTKSFSSSEIGNSSDSVRMRRLTSRLPAKGQHWNECAASCVRRIFQYANQAFQFSDLIIILFLHSLRRPLACCFSLCMHFLFSYGSLGACHFYLFRCKVLLSFGYVVRREWCARSHPVEAYIILFNRVCRNAATVDMFAGPTSSREWKGTCKFNLCQRSKSNEQQFFSI